MFKRMPVPDHSAHPNVNPKLSERVAQRRPNLILPEDYVARLLAGDRVALSRAITLVESSRADHQEMADQIVAQCLPHSGKSFRIGITGAPGVGKSTFIETFGLYLLSQGRRVAVLAVDPSSQVSKGSILGDKTRMLELASQAQAFIRPSPSGESLGGVARKTRETILLCEAAGFDVIIVETVGVGQSETAVHSMTDFFLLLLMPGAGDELQGIKRGIVEMADLIAINKADGERKGLAMRAKREYAGALHLFPAKASGWAPQTVVCSAIENLGIVEIWKLLLAYQEQAVKNAYFQHNRTRQATFWLHESIQTNLHDLFYRNEQVQEHLQRVEKAVLDGAMTPFKGAAMLMDFFLNTDKTE